MQQSIIFFDGIAQRNVAQVVELRRTPAAFRIWDRKTKKFIVNESEFFLNSNGDLVFNDPDLGMVVQRGKRPRYVHTFSLKKVDKNGTLIYEGDIVRATKIDNLFAKPPSKVEEFIASIAGIETNLNCVYSGGPDGSEYYQDVEILGNIFQHAKEYDGL